ncbi:hypothetical protein ABPG72_005755 [Tetrahymena utriculariae]
MQKSASQLSTQYKQKISQNSIQEMQNKLQNFQQSLLQVSNKLIHANEKLNQFGEGQDGEFQSCNSAKGANYKYKKNTNKYQNGFNEKINENQVSKDLNKQFQQSNFTEFVSKNGEKQTQNLKTLPQSPQTNSKNVEVLPDINQHHNHQKADNYYLLKGKKKQKNKDQDDIYESSLHETISSRSSQNFQSSSHEHLSQNGLSKSTQINKKHQDLKYEEDSQDGISLNEQRKRILQGVQELKKLRERRFTFKKLKKIDKLKQRISVLQELEKQIPLIQTVQKQKEIENKLNMNGDGEISDMSFMSQDECLSRNSDDFIFQKLDQISVTEMNEENEKDRIKEIDEIICPKEINKNQLDFLPSINISAKSSKNANALESIMEEHQDYFNHIAGKCACGQCECGRCHVKCLVNQKKPQVYNMKWESSYNRSYSHSQNNIFKDQYDIKMMRKPYQPHQSIIPFDYTSTFKRDYQNPPDINFQRVVKYDRIKESPLYSLSTYKSNYVDWKIGVKEEPIQIQPAEQKTVVQGVPLIGFSTMKKDYQQIDHVKTNTAKPPDQSPLPRFSIHRSNFKKHNDFNQLNQIDMKNTDQDMFKQKVFKLG